MSRKAEGIFLFSTLAICVLFLTTMFYFYPWREVAESMVIGLCAGLVVSVAAGGGR